MRSLLILLLILSANQGLAKIANTCEPFIRHYESAYGIPPRLLAAISFVESGRKVGKSMIAWPWTINANGKPYIFATKHEAILKVRHLRLSGIQSIDVGCMQVNLKQHPQAFKTLEEAFNPATNVAYAAKFLKTKKVDQGSWEKAIAYYHSSTPKFHLPYKAKVLRTLEKVRQKQNLLFSLSDLNPTPLEVVRAHIESYKGQFIRTLAAPSGRLLPVEVRFAPYTGFTGNRKGILKMRRFHSLKAGAKVILNSKGEFPFHRVFFIPKENFRKKVKACH